MLTVAYVLFVFSAFHNSGDAATPVVRKESRVINEVGNVGPDAGTSPWSAALRPIHRNVNLEAAVHTDGATAIVTPPPRPSNSTGAVQMQFAKSETCVDERSTSQCRAWKKHFGEGMYQQHETWLKTNCAKTWGECGTVDFTHVVAASSPLSAQCSQWLSHGQENTYRQYGSLCGIPGSSDLAGRALEPLTHVDLANVDPQIDQIWNLITYAYDYQFKHEPSSTLRVYLTPEWTFRRYPLPDSPSVHVPPLTFGELQHIKDRLEQKFSSSQAQGYDWSNWLIATGSVYWGIEVTDHQDGKGDYIQTGARGCSKQQQHHPDDKLYVVFNTALMFYKGQLLYHHNKYNECDNLDMKQEVWGYDLLKDGFWSHEECEGPGQGGHLCGSTGMVQWMRTQSHEAADALEEWGIIQPAKLVIVNGLAVGIDICVDYGYLGGGNAATRMEVETGVGAFDIQLMVSAGMNFADHSNHNALAVRQGGIAVAADGAGQGSPLYVKTSNTEKGATLTNDFTLKYPSEVVGSWLVNGHYSCSQYADDTTNWNVHGCEQCEHGEEPASNFCLDQTGNKWITRFWRISLSLPLRNYKVTQIITKRIHNGKSADGPVTMMEVAGLLKLQGTVASGNQTAATNSSSAADGRTN